MRRTKSKVRSAQVNEVVDVIPPYGDARDQLEALIRQQLVDALVVLLRLR